MKSKLLIKMWHRNSQKRIIEEGLVYFVTILTKYRYPYFKDTVLCDLFVEELKLCKQLKGFNLYAFCILYDHVHLMIEPNEIYNISDIMQSLKGNFARDVNKLTQTNRDTPGSDTSMCRFPIRRHIDTLRAQGVIIPLTKRFQWQKSFFDHIPRNDHDFDWHLDYTIWNFQKHNLPDKWKYTSLNFGGLIDDY